jgi:hypothetical protein
MWYSPEHLVAFSTVTLLASTTMPNGDGRAPAVATTCDSPNPSLPVSIALQDGLEPFVRWTLENSPTFRQQCRILASAEGFSATVRLGRPQPGMESRARAVLRSTGTGLVADIEIVHASDLAELLGHEFEHVIERLDGVDLGAQTRRGEARRLADGAFETRRAIAAGHRVAQEVLENAPDRLRRATGSVWRAVRRLVLAG